MSAPSDLISTLVEPRPSISVQPGPKVLLGHPVTILCRGPAGANGFRLEKKHREDGIKNTYMFCDSLDQNCGSPDQTPKNCGYVNPANVSRDGSDKAEAQFPIQAACEGSAGSYRCIYYRAFKWSEFSEPLELMVTSKDDSDLNTVNETDSLSPTLQPSSEAPNSPSWSPSVANQVRLVLASLILLSLLGILAEAWYSEHQSKGKTLQEHTTPSSRRDLC